MTFLYGTNLELLYAMPAVGATLAATTKTCITGTAATNGPFQLPALQNIWSPGNMVGRGLMIVAAGGYDISSSTPTTLQFSFDTAVGTQAVTIATTGSAPWASSAVGLWEAQVWMTCVATGTASTWYSNGTLTCGPGSANTSTALTYMFGGPAVAAGIPTAITVPTTASYMLNAYAQWATAPTAMVCTQFLCFGLN